MISLTQHSMTVLGRRNPELLVSVGTIKTSNLKLVGGALNILNRPAIIQKL